MSVIFKKKKANGTTKEVVKKKKVTKPVSKLIGLEDSVKNAIKAIKDSHYRGTHVKVELEAQINRTWENSECSDWLLEHVSQEARAALVYGRFYRDGSVDSEYTFTVPLDKVNVVIEYIKAFKELAFIAGDRLEVSGAGMHIAILNNPTGYYPGGGRGLTNPYAENFRQSMIHLLPALYFLGSSNANSRALNYRRPDVSLGNKYNAITGHENVFEYRVFETCYDRPEAFLDFFCVIAKTLQFYKEEQVKLPFFGKIGQLFLPDDEYHLSRFYMTVDHLNALEFGLAVLKPDHKSIEELKKERNFTVSPDKLNKDDEKRAIRWKHEFKIDKERFAKELANFEVRANDWYDSESSLGFFPKGVKEKKAEVKKQVNAFIKKNNIYDQEEEYIKSKKQQLIKSKSHYSVTV